MRLALLCALLATACADRSPGAPPAQPKTDGVEGHGGIAITEPKAVPVVAPRDPRAPAPVYPEARELYLRAYVLRDSEPEAAAELFRRVAEMTPEGNDLHTKAMARLLELAPDRPR